tara:strand:- start:1363 stop:1554 length:192 start_codon:yes stop_codon:yes gene_type:complete
MNRLSSSTVIEKLKQDPDMTEFCRDLESGGLMVAMKHRNDPKVESKMKQIVGVLKGKSSEDAL